VAILGIPAIIVTLGTLNVFRGLAFIIGSGKQVDGHEMPSGLIKLVQDGPINGLDIPWLVFIALVFAILVGYVLRKTHIGRELYAVGSNSTAARLRGINTKKVVFLAYVFMGACAGMAGIMYASRYGYLNPSNTGNGFEFIVISATIIGGVSIKGGSGSVLGVVLGSFLLGSIQTVLPMLGVSGFFYKASYGTIIIIALLLDRVVQNSQMNSLAKGGTHR
jgi:rhamnose transport system permease protein